MSNYSLPKIKVINVDNKVHFIQTTIEILDKKKYFSEPIAPAWIGKDSYSFELHKLISFLGNILIFETYLLDSIPPKKDHIYEFCSTFMEDQLELIKDTTKKWIKKKYNKDMCNGDFSLWGDLNEEGAYGYTDGDHWITLSDYEKYIKNDILQIRKLK